MTLVNETSPCTSAASVLALSLGVRVAALADEIDALHRDLDAQKAHRRCAGRAAGGVGVTDRLIRIITAAAVATVAAVAAVISYRHAYELVSTHGETGLTARLVPFTVDGLILAASMLILDVNWHHRSVPSLARWCLGAGILATIGANLAHGLGHGPIGALVSAWPALALAGSFELLMTLVRTENRAVVVPACSAYADPPLPIADDNTVATLTEAPSVEQTVQAWHNAGSSQRAIARELNIDRRKVKRIIDEAA
jgi:hypothetical protein